MFSSLLLVAVVCVTLALILYFFYFNRFVAFIIGQIIRVLYWNQEASSIWVEIGAIHFSIPAGRILFKDLRYHSSNQTIKVVKGQIQWRYWIRRPAAEDAMGRDARIDRKMVVVPHTSISPRNGMVHVQPNCLLRQYRFANGSPSAVHHPGSANIIDPRAVKTDHLRPTHPTAQGDDPFAFQQRFRNAFRMAQEAASQSGPQRPTAARH
ncbi:hypothetical protein BKA70DRAFT_122091 [Coprinopsis sp. MPI-PUGE-AT-0042]|nr:hypothetical protein BKA70DRAFT_122091 [Coprinopsis sp. MPI-PUGE-AT-0042]